MNESLYHIYFTQNPDMKVFRDQLRGASKAESTEDDVLYTSSAVALVSAEGDVLRLDEKVLLSEAVETWFMMLVEGSHKTLQRQIVNIPNELKDMPIEDLPSKVRDSILFIYFTIFSHPHRNK